MPDTANVLQTRAPIKYQDMHKLPVDAWRPGANNTEEVHNFK
ncbi:hypothetical protein MY5147_004811, partial [Beauveria neobassiana]